MSSATANADCISGNCVNGQGTYTFTNGNTYFGDFIDGKRTGQGTFTYANGDKYVGAFLHGNRHGQGILTLFDGTLKSGIWEKDRYFGIKVDWLEKARVVKEVMRNERKAQIFKRRVAEEPLVYLEAALERLGISRPGNIESEAQIERARIESEAQLAAQKKVRIAKEKHDRIFANCLLDKGKNISNIMVISALRIVCLSIADDPSWLENFKYN